MEPTFSNPEEELKRLVRENERLRLRIRALERNHRELESRILQLRTLYEIGADTASMLGPASILQVILSRVMRAFDATTGLALTVSENNNDAWTITLQQGFTQQEWAALAAEFGPPTLERFYFEWSMQRPSSAPRWLVISEESKDEPFFEWLRRLNIQVWLPFAVDYQLVGGVGLGVRMWGNDYSTGDLMLLSGIIDNSVERIKSARLLDSLLYEQQELDRTRSMFEQFMAPQVVDQLLDSQQELILESRRQEVTVLMADLRRSTELVLQLDTEAMLQLLNEYFGAMTDIIFGYEGTVDKFLGDGVMAVFGAPVSHRGDELDDVTRAVESALRMQEMFEELLNSWEKRLDRTLETGLGISVCTGIAVVGNIGSAKRVEHTAIGPVVNMASRLEEMTKGGEILLDEETHRRARLPLPTEALEPIVLKGFSEPVSIYRIKK
jgi:class 3 adenylate cyclase